MKIISQLRYMEDLKIGDVKDTYETHTWDEALEVVENTMRYIDKYMRNVHSQENIKNKLINFIREIKNGVDRDIEERYKVIKETDEDVIQANMNNRVDEDTIRELGILEGYLKNNELLKALGEIRKEVIRIKKETKEYAPCDRDIECEMCKDFDKCMELLAGRESIYLFTNMVYREE